MATGDDPSVVAAEQWLRSLEGRVLTEMQPTPADLAQIWEVIRPLARREGAHHRNLSDEDVEVRITVDRNVYDHHTGEIIGTKSKQQARCRLCIYSNRTLAMMTCSFNYGEWGRAPLRWEPSACCPIPPALSFAAYASALPYLENPSLSSFRATIGPIEQSLGIGGVADGVWGWLPVSIARVWRALELELPRHISHPSVEEP